MILVIRGNVWRVVWRIVAKLPGRLYFALIKFRCSGSAPAATWYPPGVNGSTTGYFRYGVVRQYCHMPRWHRHNCVSHINPAGDRVWSYFTCGKEWQK